MNESDSERIAGFLEMHKIKPAKDIKDANLIIFNTCGVRQSAENRVYSLVHNLTKNKERETKNKVIVIMGCLADRKDVRRRLENKVDLFCNIKNFPEEIESFSSRHSECFKNAVILSLSGAKSEGSTKKYHSLTQVADPSTTFDQRSHSAQNGGSYLDIIPKYNDSKKAYVPIMTGCNNFCSYCVVPYARGREISRSAEDIIKEISELVKNDYKEITLLGQNVNSYKFPNENTSNVPTVLKSQLRHLMSKQISFPQLLDFLAKKYSKINFKFLTSHPKDFSDELIRVIKNNKNICREIHLPVQAGSDKILKAMNRTYTQKHYLDLLKKIKKIIPEASFTTDIIVGFPGETKKDFAESIKVFKTVRYNEAYINKYSPRPGTAAWKLKDNITLEEKKGREKILRGFITYGKDD